MTQTTDHSRRDFFKKASMLLGGLSVSSPLIAAIQKAYDIQSNPGSSFYDAEHIVFLMQENRSFDHCFGSLKGVRGFNDPRAIKLSNGNPVWFQPDSNGKSYPPFRLNMKDSNATWLGDLPHSWENQVDAYNAGKFDKWIIAKKPSNKEFNHIPLTMGYYQRQDIPFYYALADAFTVADQHFCSSLTGTTTNRMFFWTGKTHGADGDKPKVRNSEVDYEKEVDWLTFPEILEDNQVSWRIYQNEVSIKTGLSGEAESLLANFTDNNLEWFSQYQVRFCKGHLNYCKTVNDTFPEIIDKAEKELLTTKLEDIAGLELELSKKRKTLLYAIKTLKDYSQANFLKLDQRSRKLHSRAFVTNENDPDYHKIDSFAYENNGEIHEVYIPKGDILKSFRDDVKNGKLPTVSWLVAPQKFSDHPSSPWYGAWYVSEVLNILTENPEMWKKTIFILNYDENDGYFDHIPPFLAPNEQDQQTGKLSKGLSTKGEWVSYEQEIQAGFDQKDARESPVGLGYRVPLIVASPWSKGGWVNSQICDLTSSLMFLETFLSKKTRKAIHCPNISSWRREICGDLTSMFREVDGQHLDFGAIDQKAHMEWIHSAKSLNLPKDFVTVHEEDLFSDQCQQFISPQEVGVKPSNIIPYEHYCDLELDSNKIKTFFSCGEEIFGKQSKGAPLKVFARAGYRNPQKDSNQFAWDFAVKTGDTLSYEWFQECFEDGEVALDIHGPNGFWRSIMSKKSNNHKLGFATKYKATNSDHISITLILNNNSKDAFTALLIDNQFPEISKKILFQPNDKYLWTVDLSKTKGWYDLSVSKLDKSFEYHLAGRVDGAFSTITDPQMGHITIKGQSM
ncbi:phosphocholine-specific phospholipase C [Belliella kenyensis]|uniref:phospholipase C n=1 Tax=Belliella kenyensis TaxID=1472724 RepID=A0ABV8EK38_9BACT|nr:phospholipase C, phosphocholine-specific [Belliella kenyensis]MCH7400277.1 phospholipase C, phosphocholine-specific [Belliella kenyensis]MDN3604705.1 phospholipase C, phosphocholine-specific [Belliella kenyensis]